MKFDAILLSSRYFTARRMVKMTNKVVIEYKTVIHGYLGICENSTKGLRVYKLLRYCGTHV